MDNGAKNKRSSEKNTEEKNKAGKKKHKNREFAIITYCFVLMFVGLIGYFVNFLYKDADDFINNSHNARLSSFTESVIRGNIYSADGEVLAETNVDSTGVESRTYPYKNIFSHVIGYSNMGTAGLESTENFHMLSSHVNFIDKAVTNAAEDKMLGDNVITTLDTTLQYAAYNSLGGNNGAVVVIEVETGKILSMVSKPDFDPNTIDINWEAIIEDANSESVLFNRATLGKYPPGSTFKILTTLEYIREHPDDYQDYVYSCNGEISDGVNTIHCYGGEVHGSVDLEHSFAESCNTSYANIGSTLNIDKFSELCNSMYFNTEIPCDDFTPTVTRFDLTKNSGSSVIMATSIGQGETLASPLQMAMIAASIDNDGKMMQPYLVDRIENADGQTYIQNRSKVLKEVMTSEEAAILKGYMSAVVQEGTGTKLKDQIYEAYGKTGTAEFSDEGDSHAWFVGFAHKAGKKDIAIAVIVEGAGLGSSYAVPIAQDVFYAYYN